MVLFFVARKTKQNIDTGVVLHNNERRKTMTTETKKKKVTYQAKLNGHQLQCLRYELTFFKLLSRIVWNANKERHNFFTVTIQVDEDLVEKIEHLRTLTFNDFKWTWGEKMTKVEETKKKPSDTPPE